MKREIPPWVAGAAVAIVVLIVGAYLYFGTGPGRQAKEMEDVINASAARAGAKSPAGSPSGAPPGPGSGAPSGTTR